MVWIKKHVLDALQNEVDMAAAYRADCDRWRLERRKALEDVEYHKQRVTGLTNTVREQTDRYDELARAYEAMCVNVARWLDNSMDELYIALEGAKRLADNKRAFVHDRPIAGDEQKEIIDGMRERLIAEAQK